MDLKTVISQPLQVYFTKHEGEGEETFHARDLVELQIFGIAVGQAPMDSQRPVLILKDTAHEFTLPVPLNPLEAGLVVAQSNKQAAPLNPHKFTEQLLQKMQLTICQCVFVEIKGVHQYVRFYLAGHPQLTSIKVRAEEAMSLALSLNIPLFATRKFMDRSKVLAAEVDTLTNSRSLQNPLFQKFHHYVI